VKATPSDVKSEVTHDGLSERSNTPIDPIVLETEI